MLNTSIYVEAYIGPDGEGIPFCIMGPAAEYGGPLDTAVYKLLALDPLPDGTVIYRDLTIEQARASLNAIKESHEDDVY